MKLYIAIEAIAQQWIADEKVYKCHGTTMAYYDRKRLEDTIKIQSAVKYIIAEIDVSEPPKDNE